MQTKIFFSILPILFLACGDADKETELTEGMSAGDCTDGADNDGDGAFDCDDDGCAGSPDCLEGDTADTNSEDTSSTTDPLDTDDDGDGFTENDGDCDDSDPTIFTGAEDSTVDGIDQDCNDFDGPDADGDGFADAAAGGTDCDDSDANVNPDAEEDFTDGVDQDCDGYADVANAQCSADLTITFPNEETVTLDFCQNWSMESTFEYDPDVPPQLNSMFVELNATIASDFDCRLRFRRTGICGDGYYRLGTNEEGRPYFYQGTFISWFESTLGNQEELILETMDCLGVSDENEMTAGFEQGWLRIDSINTGTEAGSFANTPLSTEIQGKLNVWSASGLSLVGNIQLSSTQIASDQEENICDKVSDERVNADWDGDGFINPYFEGNDCDDRHYPIMLGGGAISGATAFPGSAENDSLTECMKDADDDGYGDADFRVYWHQDGYWVIGSGALELGVAGTDCDDSDSNYTGDEDGDGYLACIDDCDDTDAATYPGAGFNEIGNLALECLTDSDGDGYGESFWGACYTFMNEGGSWGGNIINVYEDSGLVDTVSFSSNSSNTQEVCVMDGSFVEFIFYRNGWPNLHFTVYDDTGAVIGTAVTGTPTTLNWNGVYISGGTLYSTTVVGTTTFGGTDSNDTDATVQ